MMKIKYSPIRSDKKIEYEFENNKITAIINGESDTFDFSEFTDGKAVNIETSLPVNPVLLAERRVGELYVELVNYINEDATEEEKFPSWQVIDDG